MQKRLSQTIQPLFLRFVNRGQTANYKQPATTMLSLIEDETQTFSLVLRKFVVRTDKRNLV